MERVRKCFVVRPFSKEYNNLWALAIKPAVESTGLEAWDGQEERLTTNVIHSDISKLVWEAEIVVADISSQNANVMYELGLAHAAKKPVIILLEQDATPPFDLAHIRYLKYDRHDLSELSKNLRSRIEVELKGNGAGPADFFPELKIFTPEIERELTYLRSKLVEIEVVVTPNFGEIFFNNQLIGRGKGTLRVNPEHPQNTLSAATIGFFDFHRDIGPGDMDGGQIEIQLEKSILDSESFGHRVHQRIPSWLRDRRRNPGNPVLMKAVSNYLLYIGERADALEEIEELLKSAPNWHLSYIQMGLYYGVGDGIAEAIPWYEKAASLEAGHFIADYSLACNHALLGDYELALFHLEEIAKSNKKSDTIRGTLTSLSKDPDFRPLWENSEHRQKYLEIESRIFSRSQAPEEIVSKGIEGYIF